MEYKYSKLMGYMICIIIGSIGSTLLFHFRFNNDLLRRELILFMENSNQGYFLTFVYSEVLILIVGIGIYLIVKRKIKKGGKKEQII